MGKYEKVLRLILSGQSDSNIKFEDLRNLLKNLDFSERIKSSHHIYYRRGVVEIINLQAKAGKAKPYQVKQVRNLIIKYDLKFSDER